MEKILIQWLFTLFIFRINCQNVLPYNHFHWAIDYNLYGGFPVNFDTSNVNGMVTKIYCFVSMKTKMY